MKLSLFFPFATAIFCVITIHFGATESTLMEDANPETSTEPKPDEEAKDESPVIKSMVVESDIRLRYASTKITSTMFNPGKKAQEAVFHVVLPETAFISEFIMEIDGKAYKASIQEKEKAEQKFQEAINFGQAAAQISTEMRDSNQFAVKVNMEPESQVIFNLTYEELLTRRRGLYEQVLDINFGQVVPELTVRVNIDEVLPIIEARVIPQRSIGKPETDNEDDDEPAQVFRHNEKSVSIVYKPSADLQKKKYEKGVQSQFVVQYYLDNSSTEGGEIHLLDGYFVHFFAPPALKAMPKHVVFVLDTSGSMSGSKLDQTKHAMLSILDQLREGDVFSVIEFSTEVKEWNLRDNLGPFDDLCAYMVTNETLDLAKERIKNMEATDMTNINGALLTALRNSQSVSAQVKLAPIIVFLTDGQPNVDEWNPESIQANVRKANSDGTVSIFSLAFGMDADYDFLARLSAQNHGFARRIYEAADASLQLQGFFEEISSPLLQNVRFVYETQTSVEDVTDTKTANFFDGSEFVVAGRVSEGATGIHATVDGNSADGSYSVRSSSCFTNLNEDSNQKFDPTSKLEKVWAYLTIQQLLKESRSLVEKEEVERINAKALNLSLKYGFVTPLTSLLVVKPNQASEVAEIVPAHNGPAGADPTLTAGTFYSQHASHSWTSGYFDIKTTHQGSPKSQFELHFSPELFIKRFTHNETHAEIPMGEDFVSLSWLDELPDKEYDACTPSYALNSTTSYCKSLWKCKSIDENEDFSSRLNLFDVCVIENKYVGICCVIDGENDWQQPIPHTEL